MQPTAERKPGSVTTWLAWLYRETSRRIDAHLAAARRGENVAAAQDFAHYVRWSGIVPLCLQFAQSTFPKIDGSHLNWKVEELLRECREQLSKRPKPPTPARLDVDEINRKLDILAAQLAKVHNQPHP